MRLFFDGSDKDAILDGFLRLNLEFVIDKVYFVNYLLLVKKLPCVLPE
jgi:hypothetical protein